MTNTTTCLHCGTDWADRMMHPLNSGGELCPDCMESLRDAAPDLLEACEYILSNLDSANSEKLITAPAWFQVQLGESAKLLRDAIAKAKGG